MVEHFIAPADNPLGWVNCLTELPPDGQVVLALSPGRMEQPLKRNGRLWFLEDDSMYVYYAPAFWRPMPASAASDAVDAARSTKEDDRG